MIEKWLQYTCDGCGETEQSGTPNITAKEIRAELYSGYGWRNYGKLDYCPYCVEKGNAKNRVEEFNG